MRSNHFFPMPGKPVCPHCRQPEGVVLEVTDTGFMCGTGFEHEPECPALRCPHGVPWQDDCGYCDAEREDEDNFERNDQTLHDANDQ